MTCEERLEIAMLLNSSREPHHNHHINDASTGNEMMVCEWCQLRAACRYIHYSVPRNDARPSKQHQEAAHERQAQWSPPLLRVLARTQWPESNFHTSTFWSTERQSARPGWAQPGYHVPSLPTQLLGLRFASSTAELTAPTPSALLPGLPQVTVIM